MIQPASKGPFKYTQFGTIHDDEGRIATFDSYDGTGDDCRANARYFAHAANVLPKCVEAMARFASAFDEIEAYNKSNSFDLELNDKLCAECDAARSTLKAALDAARGER